MIAAGIRPTTCARDGERLFATASQTGIRCHGGDLQRHFHPLAEGAEGEGQQLLELVGPQFAAHRAPDAAEDVMAVRI